MGEPDVKVEEAAGGGPQDKCQLLSVHVLGAHSLRL